MQVFKLSLKLRVGREWKLKITLRGPFFIILADVVLHDSVLVSYRVVMDSWSWRVWFWDGLGCLGGCGLGLRGGGPESNNADNPLSTIALIYHLHCPQNEKLY